MPKNEKLGFFNPSDLVWKGDLWTVIFCNLLFKRLLSIAIIIWKRMLSLCLQIFYRLYGYNLFCERLQFLMELNHSMFQYLNLWSGRRFYLRQPGDYKEMSSILTDQYGPRIWAQMLREGSQPISTAVQRSPNTLGRSNSIFNIWRQPSIP